MKKLLICLSILFAAGGVQAQDYWLYWKYKDYDGGINFAVPRWAVGFGSVFAKDKNDRKMIRKIHRVRLMVFEDGSPVSQRDMKKFNRKARRRHLEEILTIRDGKTRVQVLAKERRNTLRKVVVFVSDPEDGFFMVSLRGKLKIDEISKALKRIRKDKDEDEGLEIPDVLKFPERA